MNGYVRCAKCNLAIPVTADDIGLGVMCPRTCGLVSVKPADVQGAASPATPSAQTRAAKPNPPSTAKSAAGPSSPPVPKTAGPRTQTSNAATPPTPPHTPSPAPQTRRTPPTRRRPRMWPFVIGAVLLLVLCLFAVVVSFKGRMSGDTAGRQDGSPPVHVSGVTVPRDVIEGIKPHCPFDFEITYAERCSVEGSRAGNNVLEDIAWQQKWLDENDPIDEAAERRKMAEWVAGRGPEPKRKVPPPAPVKPPIHINGAYLIEVVYRVGGETYRKRYVALRRAGGGADMVWDRDSRTGWAEEVRAMIQ